jgi:hypothetical protein
MVVEVVVEVEQPLETLEESAIPQVLLAQASLTESEALVDGMPRVQLVQLVLQIGVMEVVVEVLHT